MLRAILGFLTGVLGMLAGWAGLAALVVSLAGPDRDGGIAMGAFFDIGPIGGVIGFVAGVFLFMKVGLVPRPAPVAASDETDAKPVQTRRGLSKPFAAVVLLTSGALAWWGWYEFIRSPYLTRGYMDLQMQFRLPSGMPMPDDPKDVKIEVMDGASAMDVSLTRQWHGTDGERRVILATAMLSMKTSNRIVSLTLPGSPTQTWKLDLPSDPDPLPGFTPWRLAGAASGPKIEMNYTLIAEH